jgi:hypothetical protein
MTFGLEKCVKIAIKRGGDMMLSDDKRIKVFPEEVGYKYLGTMQANTIKREKI